MSLTTINLALEIPLRNSSKKFELCTNNDGCVYFKDRKSYLEVAELCGQFLRESFTISQDQYLNYLMMKRGVNMLVESATPYNLTETLNSTTKEFCIEKSEVQFESQHFILNNCSFQKKSVLKAENVFSEQILPKNGMNAQNKKSMKESLNHNFSTNASYNTSGDIYKILESHHKSSMINEKLDFDAIIESSLKQNNFKDYDFQLEESYIEHKSHNYLNAGRYANELGNSKYSLSKNSGIGNQFFENSNFESIDNHNIESRVSDNIVQSELHIDDFTENVSRLEENNLRYLKIENKKRKADNNELERQENLRYSVSSKNLEHDKEWYNINDKISKDFDKEVNNFFTNFNTEVCLNTPRQSVTLLNNDLTITPCVSPDKRSIANNIVTLNIPKTNFQKRNSKNQECFNIDENDKLKYVTLKNVFDKDQEIFNKKNNIKDNNKSNILSENYMEKLDPYMKEDQKMHQEMLWQEMSFQKKYNINKETPDMSTIYDKSFISQKSYSLRSIEPSTKKQSKIDNNIPKLHLDCIPQDSNVNLSPGSDYFNPYSYVNDSCQISQSSRGSDLTKVKSNKYSIKSARLKTDESFSSSQWDKMKDFITLDSANTNEEIIQKQKDHDSRISNLESLEKLLAKKLEQIDLIETNSINESKSRSSKKTISKKSYKKRKSDFMDGFDEL